MTGEIKSHRSHLPLCRPSMPGLANAIDCDRGREFEPQSGHYVSLRFGHEIISTAILSLPLIQVRQLSATGESMHLVFVLKPLRKLAQEQCG